VRCFNHLDREAVAACKACSKGLCPECAVDLGHGIACRGTHEVSVNALNEMTTRASRVQAVNTKGRFTAPAFYAVMGSLFLCWGLYHNRDAFLCLLGGAFLLYGLVILRGNRRAFSPTKPDA
jgi:hypothetical protein